MIEVEEREGTVGELHGLDPFAGDAPIEPVVWWCRPTDDAIVLGSRQSVDLVDADACARAGLSIVRRRSGGGAVLMRRGTMLWIDVVLPPGVAPDDVRGSMVWIGEAWRHVLGAHTDRPLDVHRAGVTCSAWSDRVCFSGIGPGEVLLGGDKLVGLSQRRTRRGIRVQTLVYAESVAHEYRPLWRGDVPPSDPPGQAWLAGLDAEALAGGLSEQLTRV